MALLPSQGGNPRPMQPPPNPLPSLTAAVKNLPPCAFCDAAPVSWPTSASNGPHKRFFCCQECAAEFAQIVCEENDVFYCESHRMWSDSHGLCWMCEPLRFEPALSPGTHSDERGA